MANAYDRWIRDNPEAVAASRTGGAVDRGFLRGSGGSAAREPGGTGPVDPGFFRGSGGMGSGASSDAGAYRGPAAPEGSTSTRRQPTFEERKRALYEESKLREYAFRRGNLPDYAGGSGSGSGSNGGRSSGEAQGILRDAYREAEQYAPDTRVYEQYGGTVNTASRYGGPTGDDFVERFEPGDWWSGGGNNPYRDLIAGELARGPYDTEARRGNEARRAGADARSSFAIAQRARDRELLSMGVNPESGAYGSAGARASIAEALLTTGAGNEARERVREAGLADRDRRLQIAAMGQQTAEREREFELASYQAEQGQRQFGAQLGLSAWQAYQQQRAGDANRQVDIWRTGLGARAADEDRQQRERESYLESLGALIGDMGTGGSSGGSSGKRAGTGSRYRLDMGIRTLGRTHGKNAMGSVWR